MYFGFSKWLAAVIIVQFLFVLSSCTSPSEESLPENEENAVQADFTGEWSTAGTYSAFEQANLRIRAQENGITGVLRYTRLDPDASPESKPDMKRFFWDGQLQGNSARIELRDEEGNVLGQARLVLQDEELSVQLLQQIPELPEIFILSPSED